MTSLAHRGAHSQALSASWVEALPSLSYGSSPQSLPGLFISHGAPARHLQTAAFVQALQRLGRNLPLPRAIVTLSAHWISPHLEVSTGIRPDTWHDFGPMDPQAYALRYPAPGLPRLADTLIEQLQALGLDARPNPVRPRDHGVWWPLMELYPAADIPVLQLSLPQSFTPADLYQLGHCLQHWRQQQVLLIGSGSITHNLQQLDWQNRDAPAVQWASQFKQWTIRHLQAGDYQRVLDWQDAPFARQNHPTAEHLMPLFFAMGLGSLMSVVHEGFVMGTLGMDIYRFD